MLSVTEAEPATIRAAFDQAGELSAAVELRRMSSGHHEQRDGADARQFDRGWKPLRVQKYYRPLAARAQRHRYPLVALPFAEADARANGAAPFHVASAALKIVSLVG
jgi:hypothetical protein